MKSLYVNGGRGTITNTTIEIFIGFRVDYTIEYPEDFEIANEVNEYNDWSIIIKAGKRKEYT